MIPHTIRLTILTFVATLALTSCSGPGSYPGNPVEPPVPDLTGQNDYTKSIDAAPGHYLWMYYQFFAGR